MTAETRIDIGTLIQREPGVNGGRPCIAGTGISVQQIAIFHNQGMTPEELTQNWGYITLAQVYAALAYYYANKTLIESSIAADETLYSELAMQHKHIVNPDQR